MGIQYDNHQWYTDSIRHVQLHHTAHWWLWCSECYWNHHRDPECGSLCEHCSIKQHHLPWD